MNRILTILFAGAIMVTSVSSRAQELPLSDMQVKITSRGYTVTFQLYDTAAAKQFYAQLPLSIKVENYNNNEKIFYPPEKLDITATPKADAKAGTLAYYAPWGNVVMFYGSFGSAPGLYELGHAVSGQGYIKGMSGRIRVEK